MTGALGPRRDPRGVDPSPREARLPQTSLQSSLVTLPGGVVTVTWRRNPRSRRITLRIDPCAAHVVVSLPLRTARAAGLALLERHAGWVQSSLAALPAVARFKDGGQVEIEGVPHLIRHVPEGRGGAWLEPGCLMVAGERAFLARRVGDFLRAEARRRFFILAQEKAAAAGMSLGRVRVRDTRARWGSCSPQGALMFCWRLLMAPALVQDYVVAHEVAHLRHLDHGPDFWALAARLSPHRAAAEAWLAREGPRLLRVT
jgi:predicted metal-dependent hydrolase